MTDVLGLLAYLVLPLVGMVVWRLDFIREMPLGARLGVAMAAGSLIVALLMSSLSVIGIEWSRTVLFALLAMIGFLGFLGVPRVPRGRYFEQPEEPEELRGTPRNRRGWWRTADAGTAFCWLLTLYGTLTARHSCGDLQFTWGPKAIRWFRAGGLDPDVLHTWPQLTVDYPPLQTLLLALSNTFARQFPWWAAVLASPLFLLALLAVLRVWSRDALGTLLAAAALTYTYTLAYPAGCAEPPLLLFEAIAIGALTFLDEDDGRAQTFLAALGVAGAVFTKLEGATFAVAVFLTILLVQRKPKRAFLVIAPGALLFAAWMTFVFRNDLLYMYGGAKMPIYWSTIPVVLKTLAKVAKFNLWWLPYLVPIVLIAIGNVRRALVPVAIALLTTGATVYFYVHYPDPVWWIESSSPRVILTPLLALLIGVMAARPYARVARHGVVPEGKETEGGGRPPGGDPRGALGQV
ncbi:MAG TPA: hypothetical protein VF432_22560 [Thermoanaerobaculia bacterium]